MKPKTDKKVDRNLPFDISDYQHICRMIGCCEIASKFVTLPDYSTAWYCQKHYDELLEGLWVE